MTDKGANITATTEYGANITAITEYGANITAIPVYGANIIATTEYGANITAITEYDFSSYYDGIDDSFAPCDSNNVTAFGEVFLPTLYSLVFILGFIGNGLVVCVLVKHRKHTNLTDLCLFNLALADLLFVLTLPFYAHYAMAGEWKFGNFLCRFASASHNTGFFSSIFFMVVMTLDRYVLIMHALTLAQYRTLMAGIAVTVVVWMLSISVSLPAFIFTKLKNESTGLTCDYNQENQVLKLYDLFASNILGLVIPLLVMLVCYSRLIPTLMNMRSAKKHRVVKLIIVIVAAFFLFWAPYHITIFLKFLTDERKLPGDVCVLDENLKLAVAVTESFAYTHCCLNPIIYAFVGQKFLKRAIQLLKDCVPWIHLPHSRDFSDSSNWKSSVNSRSTDGTSTIIK